jgi:WD repeat-containing protein 61
MASPLEVNKITTYTGHRDCVYTIERGEESTFFTSGGDGMVVQWDTQQPDQGVLIATVKNSVYALQHDAAKGELYVAENFSGVHKLNVLSKERLASSNCTEAAIYDLQQIENTIWAVDGKGMLIVLDTKELATNVKLQVTNNALRCMSYNNVLNEVWIGSSDHLIYVIDATTYVCKKVLKGHSNSVFSIAFDEKRNRFLSVGRDAQLLVWDAVSKELLQTIPAHMYAINDIKLSATGVYYYTCSMDKSIKIWDANELKLLKVIDKSRHAGHGTSVNKLMSTADDYTFFSVSDDRTISHWEFYYKKNKNLEV